VGKSAYRTPQTSDRRNEKKSNAVEPQKGKMLAGLWNIRRAAPHSIFATKPKHGKAAERKEHGIFKQLNQYTAYH